MIRFVKRTFAVLLLLAGFAAFAPAQADSYTVNGVTVQKNGDGTTTVLTYITNNDTGREGVHWLHINDDGTYEQGIVLINPNPEGDDKGQVDVKAAVRAALKKGGKLSMKPNFQKTPLGKYLTSKGFGLGPVYQPGDDEGGGGPSTAPLPSDPDFAKALTLTTKQLGGHVGELEFLPNSGGAKEHVKKSAKKGSKNEPGGGDPDKKTGISQGGVFGDLPGPPELVNPNPEARTATSGQQPGAATSKAPTTGGGAAQPGTSATPSFTGTVKKKRN